MSWDIETSIQLGKKHWFSPYTDWERRVRPDFVDPTLPDGSKATELWHPVYAMINEDAMGENATFDALVEAVCALSKDSTVISYDSSAILKELKGKLPGSVSEIARRFILYRSASTAETEPPSPIPMEPLYHIIRIGPAIPRTLLSLEGSKFKDQDLPQQTRPEPVLAGVIDDYIGVANERFRQTKTSTRIEHYWKQGVETFKASGSGQGISLGREFSKSELDVLLEAGTSEEQFYKKLNLIVRSDGVDEEVSAFFADFVRLYLAAKNEPEAEKREEQTNQLNDLVEGSRCQELLTFLDGFINGEPGTEILAGLREAIQDLKDNVIRIQLDSLFAPLSDSFKLFDSTFIRNFGDAAAHGTAVMDLVAGKDLKADNDTDVTEPILAVELPALGTLETNSARLEFYILQAVHRLFYWADRNHDGTSLARVPLVINLSYGFSAGPKNGKGFLEGELAKLVAERDATIATYLVMPSGNSYRDQLSATTIVKPMGDTTVEWLVPGDDQSASFAEIRLNRLDGFKFTLTTPDPESTEVTSSTSGQLAIHNFNNKFAVYAREDPADPRTTLITVALAPTFSVEKPFHRTLPGAYILKVENTHVTDDLEVRTDVQRDDTPKGFASFGRQGYLEDKCVVGLDQITKDYQLPLPPTAKCPTGSVVDRERTLSALATSDETQVLVVGGTYEDDHRPNVADPDSREPTRYTSSGQNLIAKPDLSAITETGRVLQGILAAGPYSGACRIISGTSVAAPQVSRKLIEYLRTQPAQRPNNARALAAEVLGTPTSQIPDPRLGYGTLPIPQRFPVRRYREK